MISEGSSKPNGDLHLGTLDVLKRRKEERTLYAIYILFKENTDRQTWINRLGVCLLHLHKDSILFSTIICI